MFTGIVLEIGRVLEASLRRNGVWLRIEAPGLASRLETGESVAVDGVCQTVVERADGWFGVEAIATTLSRTTLGTLRPGTRVNLEPALALGERLGGHLVQGHVDGVGTVRAVEPQEEQVLVTVALPAVAAEVTVLHGSLTLQGVSLTVNALPGPDEAQVALIPYTREHTTLGELQVGDGVNVEGDMLGRFVVDYLKRTGGSRV